MAKQAADAMEWSVLSQHRHVGPLLWLLVVSTVFLLLTLRSSYPSTIATKETLAQGTPKQLRAVTPADSVAVNGRLRGAATAQESRPSTSSSVLLDGVVQEMCNMSMGRWVREPRGPVYTNVTCRVLPDIKNCGKYGKDHDYQYWRWQPDGCELPRFDAAAFLDLVRGKKMAFIGDSLARNQMESLLCLLSMAEVPTDVSDDPSDRFLTWYFPSHEFTLMTMWTEFFVDATERVLNGKATGSFDIHLDKVSGRWTEKLPGLNYAVLSGGNWLFRTNYLHERGRAVGCVRCTEQGLSDLGIEYAIRRATRAALEFISQCKECAGLTTLLRTFVYSHFESGSWYSGGYCNRTAPLAESEIDMGDLTWEIRNIQVQEVARIRELRRTAVPVPAGVKFGLLDVTKAMMMRADGHPGSHWSKIYGKVNDCLHWCLPGPIDMWSDVLFTTLRKNILLY